MTRKIIVFKETQDQWYCSFKTLKPDLMLVQVSLLELRIDDFNHFSYRVCVWGNDDVGMELDFELEGDAKAMFYTVISLKYVNVSDLKKLGFNNV